MRFRFSLWDLLAPRFVTEEVALVDVGDRYEIVCSMQDVEPGERFDAVATMRAFNFLGKGYFPKMIGKVKPWPTK